MAKKKVDDRAEMIRELKTQLLAELELQKRQERQEAATEPLRVVWEEWMRKVVNRDVGEEGARGDAAAIPSHGVFVLDLPFEWDRRKTCLGDQPAAQITTKMALSWRAELQLQRKLQRKSNYDDEGNRRKGRFDDDGRWLVGTGPSLTPGYRNRVLTSAQSMYTWKYPDLRNPFSGVPPESTKGSARQGFFKNEAHLQQWLDHAPLQYQRIAQVCVTSGACRMSEARLLMEHEVTWGDPDHMEIYLPPGRVKQKDGKRWKISSRVYEMLEARRTLAPVCKYERCEVRLNPRMAKSHWHNHRHLFPLESARDGRAPSKETVGGWATLASERSKILLGPKKEVPSTHHLRHTGASWNWAKSGGNALKVARDGGWSGLGMVQRYAHPTEEMLKMAAQQEEETLAEAAARLRGDRKDVPGKDSPPAPTSNARRPRPTR